MDKQQGPTDSTENYIQYPMINHDEWTRKRIEKIMHIITESLCCTAIINTKLYINYTSI